jgi:hypothetical protein
MHGGGRSLEAQQLGARLQRLYSPCTDQQSEMNMLIIALDDKLQRQ